ncbi:MAG: cysteine--tRNA ligase [Candidatus Sumerlaeaceae bacterium]
MSVRIYNTATRSKEEFLPQQPPHVSMYNCGPTVYDYFHVGNARNFVVVDAIRRHLEYRGFKVKFVQNFTDVDDKIIKRAHESGDAWDALAKRFTEAYFRNADALAVRRADVHPCATQHIPQQIQLVQKLIERGLAYEKGGDVYFRVRAFDGYGKLSGKDIDDLQEGARVSVGEQKDDALDFALWKTAKPGEPFWESPWGQGRPGWHLECSAMSMEHLGETIDIHSGGADLIFPHHENERAQSMGATGKPFVKYWLHNGFLTIDKQKMSKSLGNFFTIDQVLEHYDPAAVRFYLLSAHYRHPLDYSEVALEEAKSATARIREAVVTAEKLLGSSHSTAATLPVQEQVSVAETNFDEAMDDDFNTQRALGSIFELVTLLNDARQRIASDDYARGTAVSVIATIHKLLVRLGLDELMFQTADAGATSDLAENLVQLLIRTRQLAKENKQYKIADTVRDELAALGIRLQDHPTGTIWLKD